ncbi:MAG: zinc ABC transporter substrate-binding protein [Deltaproteobacteria bacterium]|nr:zinc ABC transporter substrate-binding protein [Deltaproteobacteria bacterium]
MRSRQKTFCMILALSLLSLVGSACAPGSEQKEKGPKIIAVTTLFPLYDFAKHVGGDRVEVTLQLPPGMEPHSFEPRPSDIIKLNRADLFIYTSFAMEPWAEALLKGLQSRDLVIVNSSRGIPAMKPSEEKDNRHAQNRHLDAADPHIWLDFSSAVKMIENIRDGFITKDPGSKETYEQNAAAYITKLKSLDERFQQGLRGCRKNIIVNGGHFAFAYMAKRYGFRYVSVYGVSPNAEPTAADLAGAMKLIRDNGLHHIFHEALLKPRVAEALSREAGVALLKLDPAGNLTKNDFDRGETFLSLMEKNLDQLKEGLQCR